MAEILTQQTGLFVISIFYGILLGIAYDIFRAFRKCVVHKDFMVHLEDIFYVLAAGCGLFIIYQVFNFGSLRFYVLLGAAAGAALYFAALSKGMIKVLFYLWHGLFFVVGACLHVLFYIPKLFVKSAIKSLKKIRRTVRIIKSRK